MTGRERSMTETELDRLLGAWFDEGAPTAPDRIAENAMAEIATIPQERDWPGVLRSSFAKAPLAWAAGILAFAVGLGVLLGPRFITDDPSPSPSPSPSGSPSAEPSQDADPTTHTSVTPIGTIDWTRFESETRTFAWGEVDGLIVGYQVDENFEATGWWTSEDGVTWSEASPFIAAYPAGTVEAGNDILSFESPDGYGVQMGPISHRQVINRDWTDNPGDPTILRREGQSWVPIPYPAAEPSVPSGLRLNGSRFSPVAALGEGDWVAPLMTFVDIDWVEVLGLDLEDAWPIWDEEPQQLEIHAPGGDPFVDEPLLSLTVTLTGGGTPTIEFRDEGGALVHAVPADLPGWTPEALLRAFRGWGLDDVNFVVSRDGEITVVRPPWPMGEDWTESGVVSALGRYYTATGTLGENFSLSAIRLWESTDGLSWGEVSLPPLVDPPLNHVSLGGTNDFLTMTISAEAGDTMWVSTDGSTWTQADIDPTLVIFGGPEATDFGYLLNGFDAAAVSLDGLTWELIDLPLLDAEPSVSYLNGRFIYGPEAGVGGVWHTWIGTLRD